MNAAKRTGILYRLNKEERERLIQANPTWNDERVAREASAVVARLSKLSNGKLRMLMREGRTR